MRFALLISSVLIATGVLGSSSAIAMSCSERNKECFHFCETNFAKKPACTSQCADAMPKCMQDGCWNTKMSNKCGYTKS